MSNVRISEFPNYPTVLSSSSDVIPIVDVTNNVNKKITVDNLFAGRSGGGTAGTVTSVGLTVPQGMAVTPASPITTNGTFQLSWSGQLPLSSLATNSPSSSLFLRGDNTWATVQFDAGTVNYIGLSMPSVFQVVNSGITTSGTITVLWDTLSGGKIPAVNLGGAIPSPATDYYLRADGIWANPVGTGIGTVNSITLSVPQGLLVNGASSATNTTNLPFVLTWDANNNIPLSALGKNVPDDSKFLRGDGWFSPAVVYQSVTPIQFLGTLANTAPTGVYTITLTGQYSSVDIPTGIQLFFGANATLGYTVQSISSDFQSTTVTFTTQLAEVHLIGSSLYKYGNVMKYSDITVGSYLTTSVANSYARLQNTPTPPSWLSGPLIPTANQGQTGQFYYVTSNGAIYLKVDNNSWVEQPLMAEAISTVIDNNYQLSIGTPYIISEGSGYIITYTFSVRTINLYANVIIQGFKYITVEGNINTVNLTLQAPPTGWTLGYYANLALAMQMAVNALPDVVPVTVTNDDFNQQLRLITSIPNVFTVPNPPYADTLQPTGVQSDGFISNITVGDDVGGASTQNLYWKYNPIFGTALATEVTNEIVNAIQLGNRFTASIPNPTTVFTVANPSTGYTTASASPFYHLQHAGDIRSTFTGVTHVAFDTADYAAIPTSTVTFANNITSVLIEQSTVNPFINSGATMYIVTNYQSAYPANREVAILWQNVTNTLTNFSYDSATGIFTNTSNKKIRASFSASIYIRTSPPNVTANQAVLWFLLDGTDPTSTTGRRAQSSRVYPTGTGVDRFVLSTAWTFSLDPAETVMACMICSENFYLAGTLGGSYGGTIEVVEV